MAAYLSVLGFWLQEADSLSGQNTKLLMIFVGIVALSILAQTIIFIVIATGLVRARKRVVAVAEELHTKAMPVIDNMQAMVRENSPKLKVITENLLETSHIVRNKAQEFDVTISDVNKRASKQAERVDGMVTSVLDATANISSSVQQSIRTPVREIAGLVNGLKAGLDVLVGRVRGFGGSRTTANDSNVAHSSKSSSARNPMDGGTDLVR